MGAAEGNTLETSGATPNVDVTSGNSTVSAADGGRPWWKAVGWVDVAIVLLAALLRLWLLDWKPPHFDEGVNGYFVDDMTKRGFYHYDPTNFHGPAHFYILFVAQTLLGRAPWVLRLPVALASIACVVFLLFGFRRWVSPVASRVAALAMAVSPGFVFYGRYAIHETWLVLALMVMVAGLAGVWTSGRLKDLWMLWLGFAGALLMKETWVVHVVALGLGGLTLAGLERFLPSGGLPRGAIRFSNDEAARVATVAALIVVFFYSGCLVDPSGLAGLVQAYTKWAHTGTAGESGHEKEWWYWLQLLGLYEWPVIAGMVGAVVVAVMPGARWNRFLRWLGISALGTLTAYSIIRYKTPWCLISWAWPFLLLFGAAVEWAMLRVDRWVAGALAVGLCGLSYAKCESLNFVKCTDESEPYVYVQSTMDLYRVLRPLRWAEARDPAMRARPGNVIQEEHHPLIWLLGDWTGVTWGYATYEPPHMDAEWLLIDQSQRDRVEAGLTEMYFRESVHLRGMAPDSSYLYLRARTFIEYFPGRMPEFEPEERSITVEKRVP